MRTIFICVFIITFSHIYAMVGNNYNKSVRPKCTENNVVLCTIWNLVDSFYHKKEDLTLLDTICCNIKKINTYKKIVEYEVTLPKGTKKYINIPRSYKQVVCQQEANIVKIKFFKNKINPERKDDCIELIYDLKLDDADFYRTSSASYCRPITNIKKIEGDGTPSETKEEYYWINRVKAFVPTDNIVIVGSNKKTTTYRILIPKRTIGDGIFPCRYVTIPNDYRKVMIIDENIYIFKKNSLMTRDYDKCDEIKIQYGF